MYGMMGVVRGWMRGYRKRETDGKGTLNGRNDRDVETRARAGLRRRLVMIERGAEGRRAKSIGVDVSR